MRDLKNIEKRVGKEVWDMVKKNWKVARAVSWGRVKEV
jgi:hypothetical protein